MVEGTGQRKRAKKRKKKREERSLLSIFLSDFFKAAALLALLHLFVVQFSVVRGSSMMPNIKDGDRLLVDRLTYNIGEVERFDVVILACPKDTRVDYVKRVIGMPGDRIVIRKGRIYVNGDLLPEPFTFVPDHHSSRPIFVPDSSYFVLGDNRPVSSDSREGWFVDRSLIKGKVRACVWPVARAKLF